MARTEPFGLDTSIFNTGLNATKIKAHVPQVTFAFSRTGISWGYKDPTFATSKNLFENEVGIWFGGYHVLYPNESGVAQATNFLNVAGKNLDAYVWDLELQHGATPEKIRETLRICCSELLNKGLPVWVYMSPGWCNSYLMPYGTPTPSYFKDVKWWLAQYLTSGAEHPGPLMKANGVDPSWVYVHQTAETYDGAKFGQPYGTKIDTNRWLKGFPSITPPTEITDTEKLTRLWVAHPELHQGG